MSKYYITCGEFKCVIMGYNPAHAAMRAFTKLPNQDIVLAPFVRVSERGHDPHPDFNDVGYDLNTIFALVFLARGLKNSA